MTERIQSIHERNPRYVKQLEELQDQQAVQQESQSSQGQTTQQYTLTPLRDAFEEIRGRTTPNEGSNHDPVLSKGKGQDTGYDQLYAQSPDQLQEPGTPSTYKNDDDKPDEDSSHHARPDSPRREQKTSYDKLHEVSPDSDNDSNGQERDRYDRDK